MYKIKIVSKSTLSQFHTTYMYMQSSEIKTLDFFKSILIFLQNNNNLPKWGFTFKITNGTGKMWSKKASESLRVDLSYCQVVLIVELNSMKLSIKSLVNLKLNFRLLLYIRT